VRRTGPDAVTTGPAVPAGEEPAGRQAADLGTPPEPSFAKSLFAGRLPVAMVFPYPRLDHDEQCRVEALVGVRGTSSMRTTTRPGSNRNGG